MKRILLIIVGLFAVISCGDDNQDSNDHDAGGDMDGDSDSDSDSDADSDGDSDGDSDTDTNDSTFFIEHVKAQPTMPECTAEIDDEQASEARFDLLFRNHYTDSYLVTNRGDKDIVIDSAQINVVDIDGNMIGSMPENCDFDYLISANSSEILYISTISNSLVFTLSQESECPTLSESEIVLSDMPNTYQETVQTVVRISGHTTDDKVIETPDYTFPVRLCCGCLVNWENCQEPCSRYCEIPQSNGMCCLGVDNGGDLFDCRSIYHNPAASWTDSGGETLTCDDCQ